jgi:hypothetical protein
VILNKLIGALPLKLHFLFWLEPKKKAKKFKTTPASLEKLALDRLNRPNSLLRRSNKDDFKRRSHLFFGSSAEVNRMPAL